MSVLSGKKVLLGVTAGIAAYKTANLVRLFIKSGSQVKVVMTPAAKEFVTPLTLSTLSKNPVLSTFTTDEDDELWNNHIKLGLWADLFVISPATANTISKMSTGNCDNLLIATYLSAKCKVFFAPAMDLDMFKHESTQQSISKLVSYGNFLIPPAFGELASGLVGEGRMAEPEDIVSFIEISLSSKLPLNGKTFLITAGPTFESIDPVRFIGNHSSGKMGFALAETASKLGAKVILISGPTNQKLNSKSIDLSLITSSDEMYEKVIKQYSNVDAVIMSAAIADFKPKYVSKTKIKKSNKNISIEVEKTKDILSYLGMNKKNQLLIGFALETDNEIENATAKLNNKNLDLIVLNSLNDEGAGFGVDTNKITIISKENKILNFPLKDKKSVSLDIINNIIELINE
ncbi:bifunctional phosphopantothenoylcysteine decarboxylase/phosphopantothenate--cysteine ligase CoaBC [Flavobacteriaceae bacterium]|jgi:phosphopantothenoylcysteine decarboxylase / phosphopantothenate---cysteine ligase|nr:bifunctional phosphopantothenoylcysteine decarboxylase/phosphopantothenate--cysteine ligase CoaBC [Flavobacteriaceae bacterium]MDC1492393.1 bifunctional phosphopantothenoylcysteine decarboxylase/phosphopantothenate--cysteine ligase CoaBC [Flavobacteriaceae bacterium]